MSNPNVVVEKNDALIEGEAEQYIFDYTSEGSPSAATAAVYIKGESTDLASTVFTGGSGTCTVSGALVTLPLLTVQSGHGGRTYRIVVAATIGSRIRKSSVEIPLDKPQGSG